MHNKTKTNTETPKRFEVHKTMNQQQQNHRLFATSFQVFDKKSMIFHENRLPVDDSREISC